MFEILENLKELVQVSERKVYTINAVFILHSKLTVVILLALSILVTCRQYLGDPINCMSSSDIKSIADNYCWIHSTFTRPVLLSPDGKWGYGFGYEAEMSNSELLAPGIRPAVENDALRVYHTYYQWVWLVLFLQAGLFYAPYWLWRLCDRGRIKLLVSELNLEVIMSLEEDEKMKRQKEAILDYLVPNMGRHRDYAVQYIICEFLNVVNVISQIVMTNAFLNWNFSDYGLGLFSLSQMHPYHRSDKLAQVFPTVTACRIATGGVAFGTMEYDLLCVLPINILNEKIYIFLWFWFLTLAGLSVLNLVYRGLLIFLPPLRRHLLQRRLKHHYYLSLGKSQIFYCSYADWFMLSKLGDNLNPVVFAEILQELHDTVIRIRIPSSSSHLSIKKSVKVEGEVPDKDSRNTLNSRESRKVSLSGHDEEVESLLDLQPPPSPPPLIATP